MATVHPYLVDTNNKVEVPIFIDTRSGKLRVLYDRKLFVKAFPEIDNPSVMSFEQAEDGSLPEGVEKETAQFVKCDYSTQQVIESESYSYDENGVAITNPVGRTNARIKYLLRGWSLSDKVPSLMLTTKKVDSIEMLDKRSMEVVYNQVQPDIVKYFLDSYEIMERLESRVIEEEALRELEEQTGIKAKN